MKPLCGRKETCLLVCLFFITISVVWIGDAGLAEAGTASGEKFVGNITQSGNIPGDFATYWNQITCENEGKWASVESTRDVMNWSGVDRAYNFAKQHGIPYKQHAFVWGSQYPSWMNTLSQTEQRAEVEEWIRLYCERYPDTDMIDVVNEPDHATPPWADAIEGAGQTGHDWVIWAFKKAREYCPDATLILNDYNVLRWNTDNFISIAQKIKNRGLLDAVGAQAHSLEDQSFSELQYNFNKVAKLGVPIYISEYDINIADDTQQLQVMQQQFPFFYENSQVAGITFWGYLYGQTWRQNTGLIRNGELRPAMSWLRNYMAENGATDPTPDPGAGETHTIEVNAYGTTGQEIITLNIGGLTIDSWQLSTSLLSYTASTAATGEITVGFINDTGTRDVFIDNIVIDGVVTLQAEDQEDNTGAYANNQCGGGSYTEWLHCNGEISFGNMADVAPASTPEPTGGCNGGGWRDRGGCGN